MGVFLDLRYFQWVIKPRHIPRMEILFHPGFFGGASLENTTATQKQTWNLKITKLEPDQESYLRGPEMERKNQIFPTTGRAFFCMSPQHTKPFPYPIPRYCLVKTSHVWRLHPRKKTHHSRDILPQHQNWPKQPEPPLAISLLNNTISRILAFTCIKVWKTQWQVVCEWQIRKHQLSFPIYIVVVLISETNEWLKKTDKTFPCHKFPY